MRDLKKIDSYFLPPEPHNWHEKDSRTHHTKMVRMTKLMLPALAAMLVGLLILLPHLKKNITDMASDIITPLKGELEKFHMENGVFYVTDSKNIVNNFHAETLDETEAGSKIIKLVKPRGTLPTEKQEEIHIKAPVGFFDQNTKLLTLKENVNIDYSGGMTTDTKEMSFDFNHSKAFSNHSVVTKSPNTKINAQGFEFYKNKNLLVYLKKTHIDIHQPSSPKTIIDADEKVEWHRDTQKMVAIGNAIAIRQNNTLKGRVLTAFYEKLPPSNKDQITKVTGESSVTVITDKATAKGEYFEYNIPTEIAILKGKPAKIENEKGILTATASITYYGKENKAIALGNVIAQNPKYTIYADKMVSFFDESPTGKKTLNRVEIHAQNQPVKIVNQQAIVTGKRGTYFPLENKLKLFDDVVINQNDDILKGDYAETDLETGISRLLASKDKKGRVSGIFHNNKKTKTENDHEKKQ